ncbi:MAG: family 2 glycosyl transferase [Gammaproteobacteria bacterium]|nr:MAG: family 2 glycosyl transferase [Gammaproteobacteria bacterium]TND05278.1 MAG: family 2 glycosyl transferase [Gammaproteobacteria bacterium]
MKITVIMPCLNEAGIVEQSLSRVQGLRARGHEVILVDGGSSDQTIELARPLVDRIITTPRGRAVQMNAGASVADGDVLLFLHADTRLPAAADLLLTTALANTGRRWGRFDVRLSGSRPALRVVGFFMNWRSRLTGIATGDQAMFMTRKLFDAAGGFPDIPLMEDITLSRTLKRHSAPALIHTKVITSSRRWEQRGVLRTILMMWRLRLAYFFGASPQQLARLYQRP